jgi:hypothetical protein
MVWTTVSMPTALADDNDVTPYIALKGPKGDVLGTVATEYVDPSNDSVYVHEHDSYRSAMAFLFSKPSESEAIGQTDEVVDVDEDRLTVDPMDENES